MRLPNVSLSSSGRIWKDRPKKFELEVHRRHPGLANVPTISYGRQGEG